MATRRPKVPRVTPPAQQSSDGSAGGDVIQADFGSPRSAHATHEAGTGHEAKAAGRADGSGAKSGAGSRTGAGRTGSTSPSGAATTGAGAKSAGTTGSGTKGPGSAAGAAAKAGTKASTGKTGSSRGKSGSTAVTAGEDNLDPVPAKAFSGRMLALAVVMVAITIMLAPTVKIFIDKRAEIAALESDISASKADQDNLKRQVSRWQDPNYVKQQARDRINMVMPGETGYWVFGSDLPAGASGSQPSAAETQDPADVPWVDSLWESIRRSATD
ncbi:FtsB family cell division protein [Arthrobacter globiformis]|uniref:Septum formation initiator family protein n=1 Tax=Arthrobacter globiformis TaxID=1665 RepID=A0A328HIP6_ARTGO|nr:septum formation initiator family protein [Arthrobacter globiformis]RAM37100.1 septum formation initiator family protein [Arthrobacter globiformis]